MKVRMAGSSLFNPELALVINAPIYSPIPLKNTYDTSNPSQSIGIPKSCKGMLYASPVTSKASSANRASIFLFKKCTLQGDLTHKVVPKNTGLT